MAVLHSVDVGTGPKRVGFLHGILGTGANWKTIASRICENDPRWSATLIDARMHGRSQAFDGPHTIEAAARDLLDLEASRGERLDAILGHSFGSKVALEFSRSRAERGEPLESVIVVDASPSASVAKRSASAPQRPDDVDRVLGALTSIPDRFKDRREFTSALGDRGIALPVAQWLSMNLRQRDDGYAFILDLEAIRELLASFRQTDAWRAIETSSSGIHLIVGTKSPVVPAEDVERFRRLTADQAGGPARTLHQLEAGHWVHVDAPDALQREIAAILGEPRPGAG